MQDCMCVTKSVPGFLVVSLKRDHVQVHMPYGSEDTPGTERDGEIVPALPGCPHGIESGEFGVASCRRRQCRTQSCESVFAWIIRG